MPRGKLQASTAPKSHQSRSSAGSTQGGRHTKCPLPQCSLHVTTTHSRKAFKALHARPPGLTLIHYWAAITRSGRPSGACPMVLPRYGFILDSSSALHAHIASCSIASPACSEFARDQKLPPYTISQNSLRRRPNNLPCGVIPLIIIQFPSTQPSSSPSFSFQPAHHRISILAFPAMHNQTFPVYNISLAANFIASPKSRSPYIY